MALKQKSTLEQYKATEELTAKFFAVKGHSEKIQKNAVLDLCEEIHMCETRGDLQQAINLLAPYWTGFNSQINLPSLEKIEVANLLLRIGSVISALGNAEQINNSQEKSREFLSQAEGIFDELDYSEGKAQCQNKMGVTYWRNGDLETAQIYFRESLFYARSDESKAIANLNIAMIESLNFKYSAALRFYEKAYGFIGKISVFTEAKIRNGIGLVYKNIGKNLSQAERETYFDKAIIEFEGALVCYEVAQNSSSAILARNNIGFLYYSIGLYDEALQVLEIAESQARQVQDKNHLSVVSDTLARTFIAKEDFPQAVGIAAASVRYLESLESSNLLANALITYGIALARNGETEKAKSAFYQSEEVALFIQDFKLAAAARLFALHELFFEFSPKERLSSYLYAVKNLSGSQEKEISDALSYAAGKIEPEIELPAPKVKRKLARQPFSLDEELKAISRQYMEDALRETRGNQSHAAALLSMSRQTFVARAKKDFSDVLHSFSRNDKLIEKIKSSDSRLICYETGVTDKKFALTEIQADYREIRRGDFLRVKLGLPEISRHIIISGQNDNVVKIGFFIKNEWGYFLVAADGSRFELNDTGKHRIIGEVEGFCRRADFQKYLAERDEGRYYELIFETLKQ